MNYLSSLKDASDLHFGRKACSLAQLIGGGFNVPNGVVIADIVINLSAFDAEILFHFDSLQTPLVSVRSSSRNEDSVYSSRAGQFTTLLNIDRSGLLKAIAAVREDAQIKGESIAVIIQTMVIAEIAGVCFTCDPTTIDSDNLRLEVVKGGCDALVSGKISPSSYVWSRATSACIYRYLQADLDFADEYIDLLCQHFVSIEQMFGHPVDIEWALHQNRIFILQARPITAKSYTLSEFHYQYAWSTDEPMWTMDLGFKVRTGELINTRGSEPFEPHQPLIYVKKGRYVCFEGDHISDIPLDKTTARLTQFCKNTESLITQQTDFFDKLDTTCVTELTNIGIVNLLESCADFYCLHIAAYTATESSVIRPLEDYLRTRMGDIAFLQAMATAKRDLICEEHDSWLALTNKPFDENSLFAHVRSFPFLALGFHDRDALNHYLIRMYYITAARSLTKKTTPTPASTSLESGITLSDQDQQKLTLFLTLSDQRMRIKNGWAGLTFFMFPFLEQIAISRNIPILDIYGYYLYEELLALILHGQILSVAEKIRRDDLCIWIKQSNENSFLTGSSWLWLCPNQTSEMPDYLPGIVAQDGYAAGIARVILCNNPEALSDAEKYFNDGDILVTDMAQPLMFNLIERCSAVVTDEGGVLSHAAIICRERGIPCVVQTKYATQWLQSGDEIQVAEGKVVLIKRRE